MHASLFKSVIGKPRFQWQSIITKCYNYSLHPCQQKNVHLAIGASNLEAIATTATLRYPEASNFLHCIHYHNFLENIVVELGRVSSLVVRIFKKFSL